jgi:hypothetical protein
MENFFYAGIIGAFLMMLTSAVTYEILVMTWRELPRFRIGRLRVAVVMVAIFVVHIICIWIHGFAYYYLLHHGSIGTFIGPSVEQHMQGADLMSCVYFATVVYTSLGFGDIIPTDGFRMLTGVTVLNGLVLIGWTVSFAFLTMQRYWREPDQT